MAFKDELADMYVICHRSVVYKLVVNKTKHTFTVYDKRNRILLRRFRLSNMYMNDLRRLLSSYVKKEDVPVSIFSKLFRSFLL